MVNSENGQNFALNSQYLHEDYQILGTLLVSPSLGIGFL